MAELVSKPYRQDVGSLMFLTLATRPDVAYAVQDFSRFLNVYGRAHWECVKTIIKYLKGTHNRGLEFIGESVTLSAYADSDYAADAGDLKSTSGYVTFIDSCAVT